MQAKDELEVPSDNSIGYYSANGQLSRGSSIHNLSSTTMFVPDPASMLMQKRIDDLSRGFKQLDRITDEIDYDIETFEGMKPRLQFYFITYIHFTLLSLSVSILKSMKSYLA